MECFNLIYRLLVLFSITLALIGIWQNWDKFYLFLLLFTTCLLLCGRWVRDMYAKFEFGCLWMRGRVVTSFRTLVIKVSNYLASKIQKWELSEILCLLCFCYHQNGCRGSQGVYPHCLTAMGDSFEKFKRVGDNVKISNVDGYKELVDALHSVKYLGKVVPMSKEISVRVLKH